MATCNCSNNSNTISYLVTEASCPSCKGCSSCCTCNTSTSCDGSETLDSSKVKYTGANLTCLDVDTNSSLEEIIVAVDSKICSVAGVDYSAFDIASCIRNENNSQITTPQEFAEAISAYVCTFKSTYNTFITNYNTFVTNITNSVEEASLAGITGTCASIAPTDTNSQAFSKIDSAICSIKAQMNPSDNPWNSCGFTIGSLPTNPSAAFGVILNYICTLKGLIPDEVTLPVFNNVGSCLPGSLTTTDTLFNTIGKIKTKLCGLDSINVATLTYGCVAEATNYQQLIQNLLNRVNLFDKYTFDPTYFTVSLTTGGDACGGKSITINASGLDQKVKSNSSDVTPGTLFDKLQAGTNVSLSYATPGKVIINSTTVADDHKVMVNGSDGSPDYLDTKLDGTSDASGALTLAATSNGGNSKVIITPSFNDNILAANILTAISTNPTLLAQFCALACSCNCDNPTVQFLLFSDGTHDVQVSVDQNSPALSWYNSGAITMASSTTVTSGTYIVTDGSTNPQVTVTVKNTSVGTPLYAHVYVKDLSGVLVPSSTNTTSGPITPGLTYTNSTFNLGLGTTAYVIHVDFT